MATGQDSFWLAPERGERPRTWMWGADAERPRARRAVRVPRPSLRLPRLALSAPAVPALRLPSFALPALSVPPIVLPRVAVPRIAFPRVALPQLALPRVSLPKLPRIDWRSPAAGAAVLLTAVALLVLLLVAGLGPLLLVAPLAGAGGGMGVEALLVARARGRAQVDELDAAALAEMADSFQSSNWKERIGAS